MHGPDVLLEHALNYLLFSALLLLHGLRLVCIFATSPVLIAGEDPLQVALQIALKLILLVEQSGVPVVLDGVVGASQQDACDFGPSILNRLIQYEEDPFFLNTPCLLFEERIKLVVPALAALLSGAAGHLEGDLLPLLGADLGDQRHQVRVLLVVPRSLT